MALITEQIVVDFSYGNNTDPDVMKAVRELWADYELDNNHTYLPVDEDTLDEWDEDLSYSSLVAYLRKHNIKEALLHYYW